MANITIRNLDDSVKHGLRLRAARHGRSMEDEVRHILRDAVDRPARPVDLAARIRARVEKFGGVELDLPPREPLREPPAFGQV
ncbi:FitA-like ribbon-helix-helix domain-containing protein [Tabrizicola soli]|uniref:Plasmid stabilization protein n=1 Tax=Tabrizicola soli TaxID=2185115 RepID=A0ABV7DXF3_9RHOB|nr:plasmid stabilization protein [Tabrizicola soli]